jgi:DNA polymerase III sliding clamp (beta) subunit (PCNA family)
MQAIRVKLDTGLKRSCLIRGTSLQHIVNLAMDELAVSPSWVHFRNKAGLIFSCRRYTEDYPDLSKIFLLGEGNHSITLPRGLADASDRAAIFATDKAGDPLVLVSLETGRIQLTGEGITGWYKEAKKANYKGPSMEFSISPALLKRIISEEKYSDAKVSPDKLKVEGGNWKYITVLGNNNHKKREETVKPKSKE